jgi:hypothetical protein
MCSVFRRSSGRFKLHEAINEGVGPTRPLITLRVPSSLPNAFLRAKTTI